MQLNFFDKVGVKFDRAKVQQKLTKLSEVKANSLIDIFIVDEKEMSDLHQKWMETYEPTDVLSFPLEKDTVYPDGLERLGDIVICYPVAVKQAAENGRSVQDELEFLAEHGCLHLLGHHHE